jgi:tetratricopeptide (TPR) repeat protein
MTLGATLYFCRHPDEAIAQLETAVEIEPHLADSYQYLGEAYEQKGMYDKAIATYENGITRTQRHPYLVAALGHAYAMGGDRGSALSVITELHERSQQEYISPYLFAIVYLGLGDGDQTFIWLNKAFEDRSFFLLWLNVEPAFDTVRSDKRFTDLLRRTRHIQ